MPTMTLVLNPPGWSPSDVEISPGGTVTFKTSDDSTRTIEVVPQTGTKFNLQIPDVWYPPGAAGFGYRVIYSYKGGVTTGHVNIGVGGDGKAS